ncbi:MAG: glycoside hydrolase family 9 protein [Cyanobacteria bacterium P01_A01_bin.15]
MALRIETGELVRGRQITYDAQPGDVVNNNGWVSRRGKTIGQIMSTAPDLIWLVDRVIGPQLNLECVDTPDDYQIATSDGTPISPISIHRKSDIRGMARTGPAEFDWPMVHTIFLKMPEVLTPGETYRFDFAGNALQDTEFVYKPEQTRSEAVQVSHLGFDPDDPAKVAFLSTWMGDGGGLDYAAGKPFWLIDTATGKKVFRGQTVLSQAADTKDLRQRNHHDTDVFVMDFSEYATPGQYRVYVDGVGTSYEFEIGENTWQESQPVMAYGPGIWSSYIYANVAARAAYVLADYDETLANTYQTSALRAMAWADAELAQQTDRQNSVIYDERHLAAAELYRLTGEDQWHQIFLNTTVFKGADAPIAKWQSHDHSHAAFVYARTNQPAVNQQIQQNAIGALVRAANADIQAIESAGFKWNVNPKIRIGWGAVGAPKTQTLFRAHTLTGNRKYLSAGILATQFSAGANPKNMVYTTGIGHRNPVMPLVEDARVSGQEPPPGITVYGPLDIQDPNGYAQAWDWSLQLFADKISPPLWEWPTSEAYFDAYNVIPMVEFTVHQSIGPTAYAWGYLAASDPAEKTAEP